MRKNRQSAREQSAAGGAQSAARGDEYAALEADAGDDAIIEQEADEFASIDAEESPFAGEDIEHAYPPEGETRVREQELQEMLHEAVSRDPETLASEEARVQSGDRYRGVPMSVRKLLDDTPFEAEDLDAEEIIDKGE